MSKRDYYEVLGLKKGATSDEIKKAYRKLAKEHHPDKGGSEDKFKEISEAYDTLSDSDKKTNYDRFGHSKGGQQGNPFGGFRNPFRGGGGAGFGGRPQTPVGSDMSLLLKLTLEEIFTGAKKTYKYTRKAKCGTCNGHGGEDVVDCGVCGGSGHVVNVYNTPMGHIQQVTICNACNGLGNSYTKQCKTCTGNGLVDSTETVEVDIPAGVMEGMTFVMAGKGHGVKGGTEGDLHIKIHEIPHKNYTRSGSDLKLNLKLSYPQLILGDKVEIETIEGSKIRITIPEYSDVGNNLRIPYKGIKTYGKDGRGDVLITLGIDMPNKLDDDTKALVIDLKEKLSKNVATEQTN
jgi:molecular chaperone DnaJ